MVRADLSKVNVPPAVVDAVVATVKEKCVGARAGRNRNARTPAHLTRTHTAHSRAAMQQQALTSRARLPRVVDMQW